MRFSTLLLALATQILAQDHPAVPLATGQPKRVTYQANLQDGKPGGGYIAGVSSDDGTGVSFNINFVSLPDVAAAGPFAYHIHVNRIPDDGNCTAAGGHLMPFDGPPDTVPCNITDPQYCQVGDMSGKHGKITAENSNNGKFNAAYTDVYVSAIEGNDAFFGNRSIVIHAANGTRLNCGNFDLQPDAAASNGTYPGSNGTYTPPSGSSGGGYAPQATSGSPSASGSAQSSPSQLPGSGVGTLAVPFFWAGVLGLAALFAAS